MKMLVSMVNDFKKRSRSRQQRAFSSYANITKEAPGLNSTQTATTKATTDKTATVKTGTDKNTTINLENKREDVKDLD